MPLVLSPIRHLIRVLLSHKFRPWERGKQGDIKASLKHRTRGRRQVIILLGFRNSRTKVVLGGISLPDVGAGIRSIPMVFLLSDTEGAAIQVLAKIEVPTDDMAEVGVVTHLAISGIAVIIIRTLLVHRRNTLRLKVVMGIRSTLSTRLRH